MEYLEYLDISHNKLKTISSSIFGIRNIAQNVRIIANDNVWHCDCTLKNEMNTIFASSKHPMYCWSPEAFKNCSVFDERFCYSNDTEESYKGDSTTGATITSQNSTVQTTESPVNIPTLPTPATVPPNEVVALECLAQNQTGTKAQENIRQNLWWPQINFFPKTHGSLTVQITVELEDLNSFTFGIVWFSKTTKEYYMMELFPDEYGFGCYFRMPLKTIVTNLVPNVAYTFCLIDSNQNSVSPFSCKSVHISGNIEVYYFSWISEHIRSKGISWMILGIVAFLFLGIIFMFLVLKQKPDWLRGSKRVMKPKSSSGNIVVLPRGNTVQNLERHEAIISGSNPNRLLSCISRNNSSESISSTQSYMIANLYESVPAYMTLDEVCISVEKGSHKSTFVEDTHKIQLSKRLSSDPLPAVPRKYM
ncbi:uncharacterized protein LOC117591524 [Drosophila guanche]|uniref:Uncharacterized protein n=1 Tax=Drosophila guanche TaxID=7266 RepID=A0A3B0KX83_DROGU|nr:uncharacterized protein LOC117591524 [Drosophila guanche]SPP90001.1 Hypothetical predicted protein [Drosophila guanche]